MLLERAQVGLGLALEADHREHGDAEAELRGVEFRVIALDDPAVLERAHTAQARGSRQTDALRQIDVGNPAFRLQFCQQPAIDAVERRHAPPMRRLLKLTTTMMSAARNIIVYDGNCPALQRGI